MYVYIYTCICLYIYIYIYIYIYTCRGKYALDYYLDYLRITICTPASTHPSPGWAQVHVLCIKDMSVHTSLFTPHYRHLPVQTS